MNNEELAFTIVTGTLIPVLASFVIGYYLSIAIEKRKKHDRKKEYFQSLKSEFEFLQEAFEKQEQKVKKEGPTLSIKYGELKAPFLESLINAGMFHEFSVKEQRQLAKVNGLLNYYNSVSHHLFQIATLSTRDSENIEENATSLNKAMNLTLDELKSETKVLLKLLTKGI